MKTTAFDFIAGFSLFGVLLSLSTGGVLLFITPFSAQWLGVYHVIADFFIFLLFYGLLSAIALRILLKIFPLKTGEYPMDNTTFTLWKLLTMIYYTGHAFLLPLTLMAARPLILKLFGAKIGNNVAIGGHVDCPALLTLGNNTILGNGSQIAGSTAINDKILIGEVKLGNNVIIGINAVVLPNVEIGDNASVEIGSVVYPGSRIPAKEKWRGNPARKWL